ncbi:aldehyde-activating protein [Kiloniella litopenaei]|uniref:Aldehyde-activating protein n=1 Tax=Kiloniella litopenaei TaxID=1549748 RepID=A0A0M2RF54_9PROT|nr:aldehyde-activating protein [Kiloniella litopenaei]KKJ78650.1 aldehyde-activating protein [Kiloniella litopenaei]
MEATCHCQSVRLTINYKPEFLLSCNCSICHRYGALWTYSTPDQIKVECSGGETKAYKFGKETKAFHHCENCGCVTHWVATDKYPEPRIAVNARLFERHDIEGIKIRKFDGADTWSFIDE